MAALAVIFAFGSASYEYRVTKRTAEVNQFDGLHIFFASEPVAEYEVLGTVKVGMTMDSETKTRLKAIAKKANKKYPKADGIVFRMLDFERADVIRFKNTDNKD